MKFQAAVLNQGESSRSTIETLEMAPLGADGCSGASARQRLVPYRSRSDPGLARLSVADRARPRRRRCRGSGGQRSHASEAGDHVICSWNPHCGHCFYCERDLPILCEPFSRNQPRGFLLDGKLAHVARRCDGPPLFGNVDARPVHRRAGVGRDRRPEGDSFRSRLHHRLRRDDRRRRGSAQGQSRRLGRVWSSSAAAL